MATLPTLRETFEFFAEMSAREFQKRGRLAPSLAFFKREADGAITCGILPRLDDDKSRFAMLARAILKTENAFRYIHMEEVWMLQTPALSEASLGEIGREGIADRPDRIEALYFIAYDQDEGIMLATQEITRDAKGKPSLRELHVRDSNALAVEGRFAGLLPPKGGKQ